jgi:hypothetical protein
MSATPERSFLHVEGKDDLHAISHLLIRHGIDYDHAPWPESFPTIKPVGSKDELLAGIETAVALSSGRSIGFVLDADSSLESRWAAVSSRLRRSGVDAPPEVPPGGFVGETSQYRARVGAWVMPDNRRDGTLERFLEDLVRENDRLLPHAKASTRGAKELDARFPDVLVAKAELHAWLAWQEDPGLPYGSAIRARYFSHDSQAAKSFVIWFCRLYGIARPQTAVRSL